MNRLLFGDNLNWLRDGKIFPDACVDLVYLDPPFNSNADYNVLFREATGESSLAQFHAFTDTWNWADAKPTFDEFMDDCPNAAVVDMMQSLYGFLRASPMMAYLAMMAPRLMELHRLLKPTGSLYLHCDPTASHYLRVLLDGIFDSKRMLNEICWKRSAAHSDTKQGMKRCGRIHDVILLYTKTDIYTWNPLWTPYTEEYLEQEYRHFAPNGRRYKETDLTAAKPGGDVEYDWRVKRAKKKGARCEADLNDEYKSAKPDFEYRAVRPYHGRYWAYKKKNLVGFAQAGKLIHRATGMPRLMQFSQEMPGIPLQDLWMDIPPESGAKDLGY